MTTSNPYVSIGLPVYNGEDFIKEAITSILSQTFSDFELIISDNASTDRTEEICRSLAAQDSRIQYYRNEKNFGAAYNYNRTFEFAKGKYFKWASHDDVCTPNFLKACVDVLDHHPDVVLVYSKMVIIDDQGQAKKKDYSEDLNLRSPKAHERYQRFHQVIFPKPWKSNRDKIGPVFGLMRYDVLKETPLIGKYYGSDLILLAEMALRGQYFEIPEELFLRRIHGKRGLYVSPTPKTGSVWFDSANQGKILIPRFQMLAGFLDSLQRVNLPPNEKFYCYLQMARWLSWGVPRIGKDVLSAIEQSLSQMRAANSFGKEELHQTKSL